MNPAPHPLAPFLVIFGLSFAGLSLTRAQVSQETLDSISIPDKVETAIGTLDFFDGVPSDPTIAKLYDNLDRMRGVQVYLDHSGAASLYGMRIGNAEIGAPVNSVTVTEQLLKSESIYLTGNTSTLYAITYLQVQADSPLVVELPPGMLGFLDDAWFRFVENMGVVGPDQGKGGRYLLLPPGYEGEVPTEGYFVVKMTTHNNLMFLRGSIAKGLEAAVENIKSGLKIYPLSKADTPPVTQFTNISGKSYNTVVTRGLSFYQGLNQIVQEEPINAIGPEMRGNLAAIGIVKGKPFQPDARMQKLLIEAADIGAATARAITVQPRVDGIFIYPEAKSAWSQAYANKNPSFKADGTMGLDARVSFYYNYTGVTPAMASTHVGKGSDYAVAFLDAEKNAFDGAKTYKLHLPKDVPVNDFWAVTLYDTQTRSLLQTSQTFPTVGSQDNGIEKNADGSYDIYFAPKAPQGKEGNWLETVPGKSWFAILRMYGPLEPWIDKTWRPSEIELVK